MIDPFNFDVSSPIEGQPRFNDCFCSIRYIVILSQCCPQVIAVEMLILQCLTELDSDSGIFRFVNPEPERTGDILADIQYGIVYLQFQSVSPEVL